MDIEEKEQKIKELQDKLESVKQELEVLKNIPEKWQDQLTNPLSSDYWYITGDTDGFITIKGRKSSRKPEHAFMTQGEADLVKEKMLLMQEMLAFAHVRNEGWEPDWGNHNSTKYGIILEFGKCKVHPAYIVNSFTFGVTVKSLAIANEMLSIFGERINKYYNRIY